MFVNIEPLFDKKLATGEFTVSAGIEEDRLVILILVHGVGAMLQKHFDHFQTVLIGGIGHSEVQGGLSEPQL